MPHNCGDVPSKYILSVQDTGCTDWLLKLWDVFKVVAIISFPGVVGEVHVVGTWDEHKDSKDQHRPRSV